MASSEHDDHDLVDLRVKFEEEQASGWTAQNEQQCSNSNSSEDTICGVFENDKSIGDAHDETNQHPHCDTNTTEANNTADPFVVYIKREPVDDEGSYPGVPTEEVGESMTEERTDAVTDPAVPAAFNPYNAFGSETMDEDTEQPPLDEQGSKTSRTDRSGQPATSEGTPASVPRKLYYCDVCPKSFPYSYSLTRHKRTHEEGNGSSWQKTFNDPLKAFIRTNVGAKPVACPECGKVFVRSSDLKRHEMIHTGEKLFKCEECGKSFTQASNLKTHQLTHTGEKTFTCDVCSKSFKLAGHLKTHKMIHNNERSFECDECGKAFTQQSNLKRHKVIHTGHKEHVCKVCSKCFTHASGLKRHAFTHNKETAYECDGCAKTFTHPDSLKRHKRVNPECSLEADVADRHPQVGIAENSQQAIMTQNNPQTVTAHNEQSNPEVVSAQFKLDAVVTQCKPQVVKAECSSENVNTEYKAVAMKVKAQCNTVDLAVSYGRFAVSPGCQS